MSHVSFVDSKTGEWIQCFTVYGRTRCYVRDWVTARFVRMVRDLYLVFSVSYVYCKRRHETRNIIYRLTVSIDWNYRDIAVTYGVPRFLDIHDSIARIVIDKMMDRILSMTWGNVSSEYIGLEHTQLRIESIEDICRCPETGIETWIFKHYTLDEYIAKFQATRCKHYISFCEWLKELENEIKPLLGVYSGIVYPDFCKGI
jgi:hypothetical protein